MKRADRALLRAVLSVAAALAAGSAGLCPDAAAQTGRSTSNARTVSFGQSDRPSERWRVRDRPEAVIGGDGAAGPSRLSDVSAVLRFDDGALAVSLLKEAEIRVFDSIGNHIRTIGRHGRGPGLFSSLWQIYQVGDTIIGIDGLGVGQAFTRAGRYVRAIPRATVSWEQVRRIGYLADGSLVGYYADRLSDAPRGTSTQMITLVRVDQLARVAVIGRFKGATLTRHGTSRPRAIVYGPRVAFAVLAQFICVGFSDQYDIRCVDSNGILRLTVRRAGVETAAVAEADRNVFLASIDSANPLPRGQAIRDEVRKNTDFADRFALFGRFVASSDNRLWVGPVASGDGGLVLNSVPLAPTVWSVYSTTGEWVAEVTAPAGFRLMAAAAEHVVGLAKTLRGADKVVVYRLIKK